MSKKIAQLTKVIYYLNTKNEDHNVEVQSLIDAYEGELSEAIRDGTSQIEELRSKLDESQIKVQAQEAVIQQYLETLSQNELRIEKAKGVEAKLQEEILELERKCQELQNRHAEDVQKLSKEVLVTASSTESLKVELDTELKRVVERYEARLAEINDIHDKEMFELRSEHGKEITKYIEDARQAQDQLKDIVSVLNKQSEEKIRGLQNEVREQKEYYEQKIADMERDYEVASTSQKQEITKELDVTTERLADMSDRCVSLEQDLGSKTVQLAATEATLRTTRDGLEKAQNELTTLTQSLDSAIITIRELNEKIHDLNRAKAEADVQRIEKERAYKQLAEEMREQERQLKQEMHMALLKQEAELKATFDQEMRRKVLEMEEVKIRLLQEKQKEVDQLVEKVASQAKESEKKMASAKAKFDEERDKLNKAISDLEDAKSHLKDQIKQLSTCLDEKVTEINTHLETIKTMQQTIKTLEVDKADMFQKMLRIDDQIRGEMNEKFRLEKGELLEEIEAQHAEELERLRDSLNLEHHLQLQSAVQRTESEYGSKIAKMTEEYLLRSDEWEQAKTEYEKKLASNADEIKIMLKTILELKESHSRAMMEMKEEHSKGLEAEKKNWELETSARETQMKVSTTIMINNMEKKTKLQIEELEASHKKQIDDIRKEHTIDTLNLKKEAESQRNHELAKQKSQHEEEIAKLNQAHINELAQTVLSMNVQRIGDLKAANEAADAALKKKDVEIQGLNNDIEACKAYEEDLQMTIESLRGDIAQLNDELQVKAVEAREAEESHRLALQNREAELAQEHENEIRRVNEEHISEAEKMIAEFDKAQAFLKKQIAAQAKQTLETEIYRRFATRITTENTPSMDLYFTFNGADYHLSGPSPASCADVYQTLSQKIKVSNLHKRLVKLMAADGSLLPIGPRIPKNDAASRYTLLVGEVKGGKQGAGEAKNYIGAVKLLETLKATNAILNDVSSLKQNMKTVKSKIELDSSSHLFHYTANNPAMKPAIERIARLPIASIGATTFKTPTFSQEVLEHLKHPTFDIWQWSEEELIALIEWMFEDLNLIKEFSIDRDKLRLFLCCIRYGYNKNPFHNFQHCFCVTQMVYGIIYVTGVQKKLTSLEKLIIITAAIGHDLDHPGFNNAYQINASTELAIVYNDISPLENHHAALLFALLKHEKLDFLANLSAQQYRDFRKSVINCILATDMAKHGEILSKFKTYVDCFDLNDASQRQLLLQLIIKCADISNEVRPKHVAEPWVDKLLEEFFGQSDKEKKEGLPTAPFMDREKVTKASAQVAKVLPNMETTLLQPIRRAHEFYKGLLEKQ
ncbi:High affinity cAMP-specific and IBMX-insensitive 3',5'-cyclic phosphodiesterase 9A [Phlyctochytrium bullatum]|nr:High affinity cAMP-specific and IBMX-insensitive 3',5'-cyclic phosphodiesterase 9A [Phlyctochytrium bullatum]